MTTDLASTATATSLVRSRPARLPYWKRPLDVTLGLVAIALLSPVMLAAAAAIRLTGRGPILFRQTRIGRDERPFTMMKFRTMRVSADNDRVQNEIVRRELGGGATPDAGTGLYRPAQDPRVTQIGRFLRKLSIDELPQLFNVVRGDMSLVGPRPATPEEVQLFTPEQRRRHQCLPGITGLWQVSGRNRLSSREMLELDLVYVERCSLRLDLAILLSTPRAVLFDRFTG